MNRKVAIEVIDQGENFVFNIIFVETGEIRQKKRSRQWMLERLFKYELKTWNKRGYNEVLRVEETTGE